jgi:hypothetical protein
MFQNLIPIFGTFNLFDPFNNGVHLSFPDKHNAMFIRQQLMIRQVQVSTYVPSLPNIALQFASPNTNANARFQYVEL